MPRNLLSRPCKFFGTFWLLMVFLDIQTSDASAASSIGLSSGSITPDTPLVEEKGAVPSDSDLVIRFYFIRHGRTEANEKGLVLGQIDSPLTREGIDQARALGREKLIKNTMFWRKYTSDLGRAQQTTRLILGEDKTVQGLGVRLEPRLRELAKGVREGLLKKLTYEEAEVLYRIEHGEEKEPPLLETEEDAWNRVRSWMCEVAGDAICMYRQECSDLNGVSPRILNVFVVSHSATLRMTVTRLVPDQLPASVDLSPQGRDGASKNALVIPNTSLSIIDIIPNNINDEIWDEERASQILEQTGDLWSAKLRELAWTEHYDEATTNARL